jgi:glycogen synthase
MYAQRYVHATGGLKDSFFFFFVFPFFQMYAQRYGTVPVVHATGGLKDSVIQYDPFAKEVEVQICYIYIWALFSDFV